MMVVLRLIQHLNLILLRRLLQNARTPGNWLAWLINLTEISAIFVPPPPPTWSN